MRSLTLGLGFFIAIMALSSARPHINAPEEGDFPLHHPGRNHPIDSPSSSSSEEALIEHHPRSRKSRGMRLCGKRFLLYIDAHRMGPWGCDWKKSYPRVWRLEYYCCFDSCSHVDVQSAICGAEGARYY